MHVHGGTDYLTAEIVRFRRLFHSDHSVNSVRSSLWNMNDQPEIEKQKRRGEKKTVYQIERTADPRQEIPRILHVGATFDNRFGQITDDRCEPKEQAKYRRMCPGKPRQVARH